VCAGGFWFCRCRCTGAPDLTYLFFIITVAVAVAGAAVWSTDRVSALLLATIALTPVPARQRLMPAINQATDDAAASRFKVLHNLSVLLTLAHIVLAAWVPARFV
jgi:hypothetical protein